MIIRYAKAGDSTTARASAWPSFMDDSDLVDVGGLAISGANSAQILAKIAPADADVLVVMLGINDISDGLERRETKANIEQIVAKVGARHVVLAAIAPNNLTDDDGLDRQNLGYALNRDLAQLAADHGWLFVDPWSAVRLRSNGWVKGTADPADGVHPLAATSEKYVAPRFETYIRQAVEGARA